MTNMYFDIIICSKFGTFFILFNSFENFLLSLTSLEIFPVCNSTHFAPIFLDNFMFLIVGSINKLVLIFFYLNFLQSFLIN